MDDTSATASNIPPAGNFSRRGLLASDLPFLLTVEELAELLRINVDTAYRHCAEGKIPGARKVCGSVRIYRDRLLEWLAGQDRVSSSPRKPR